MNRRSFIKLFGYIPGLALLPSLGQAAVDFNSEELPEQLLNDDNLAKPLYDSLLTASKFLEDIPKYEMKGNALAYNQVYNDRIIYASTSLNTVRGKCDWMGIGRTSLSGQLNSKVRSCGRKVLDNITNSDKGLISLAGSRKKGLEHLFDSDPEWIMASGKEIRQLKQIPELMEYVTKHNIQIYHNDWMSTHKSEIIAGKFDDGTNMKGCSLMYPEDDWMKEDRFMNKTATIGNTCKGLNIVSVQEDIYRVEYYQNLVIWNRDDIMVIEV